MSRLAGVCALAVLVLFVSGCTDAATRLAYDLERAAADLRKSGEREATVVHRPKRSPEGCSGDYEVVLRRADKGPGEGRSLTIGCVGSSNYRNLGYSYSTTYHLNFVRVPGELRSLKPSNQELTLTLRRDGEFIDVVAVK